MQRNGRARGWRVLQAITVAGLTISESRPDTLVAQPALSLILEIGSDATARGAELERPGSIAVGPDGRVYVAEMRENVIKVFGRDGKYIKTFGQAGQGPGDFISIMRMSIANRVLSVQDGMARRVSDFDLDGKLLGTRQLPQTDGARPAMTHQLRSGFVLSVSVASMNSGGPTVSDPFSTGVLRRSGAPKADTLFRHRSDMAMWRPQTGNIWNAITSGFGDSGAWAILGDSVVAVANGVDGIVRWLRVDNTGVRVVRQASLGRGPVTLTATDSASLLRRFRAEHQAPRYANMQVMFDGFPSSRSLAAASLFSSEGTLWVSNAPPDGTPTRWAYFPGSESTPRHVTVPVGFELRAVRDGMLYGVALTDDDVPVVRVYALR